MVLFIFPTVTRFNMRDQARIVIGNPSLYFLTI